MPLPSLPQLGLRLRATTRRLWFRAAIYGGLAILTALAGAVARPFIPQRLAGLVGADSVGNLLTILASSMLAVTTFSLSTMVAAYGSAASGATPRATRLLIADSSAQSALATFIGAFLFAVVGLIALSTGLYGDGGRVVLFAATIVVIVIITLRLLAWIEQLSGFGRLGDTLALVEKQTRQTLHRHLAAPLLGGHPDPGGTESGTPLFSPRIGHVAHIDMARLQTLAEQADCRFRLAARPGAFVTPARPLLWVIGGTLEEEAREAAEAAFTVRDERSFEQDPRFGFVVLTEIGSRALSPATNDPGTAVEVIGVATRLLCEWARADATAAPAAAATYDRVWVPAVAVADVFDDIVPPLARDGAGLLEVAIRIQKGLAAVAACGDPDFATQAISHAARARERALAALAFAPDREALRTVCAALTATAGAPSAAGH